MNSIEKCLQILEAYNDDYMDFGEDYDIFVPEKTYDLARKIGLENKKIAELARLKKLDSEIKIAIQQEKEAKNKKIEASSEDINSILKGLKGKNGFDYEKDIDQFINRTVEHLIYTVIKNQKIDYIMNIHSTSPLSSKFAKRFAQKLPGAKLFIDAIVKNDVDQIWISDEAKDVARKTLQNDIRRTKDNDQRYIEMKTINGGFRRFLRNFMKLDPEYLNDKGRIINFQKMLKGKNILVVDDILTSGATFMDAFRILKELDVNNAIGVTIFKSQN